MMGCVEVKSVRGWDLRAGDKGGDVDRARDVDARHRLLA